MCVHTYLYIYIYIYIYIYTHLMYIILHVIVFSYIVLYYTACRRCRPVPLRPPTGRPSHSRREGGLGDGGRTESGLCDQSLLASLGATQAGFFDDRAYILIFVQQHQSNKRPVVKCPYLRTSESPARRGAKARREASAPLSKPQRRPKRVHTRPGNGGGLNREHEQMPCFFSS